MIKNCIFDLGNVILKGKPSIILDNLNLDDETYHDIKNNFFNNWSKLDLGLISLDSFFYQCNFKSTISNEIKSYYDSDKEAFYIVGTFKNNTAKQYTDITLNFAVYDLNGNILGNAYAHLDQIDKNETWKFKANYDDVDATDAVSYKLIEVEYY